MVRGEEMMIDTAPALKPEDLGNHTLDVALAYLGSGLSIIPVARDGTKQPDARLLPREYDDDTGHFKATWNPFKDQCEMVESEAPGLLAKLSIAKTPKPGYHVRYRCSEVSIPGNTKLAEDPALPPKERT